MKRIALMTWHHVENYGTTYQAYALQKILQKYNCQVDVIDYRRQTQGVYTKDKLSGVLFRAFRSRMMGKKPKSVFSFSDQCFSRFFEEYFNYTPPCCYSDDFSSLNNRYHGFVCGSDQIWGPNWLDSRFFLDFVEEPVRMIPYAPSFGAISIEDPYIAGEIKKLVQRFVRLSVREQSGCNLVKKMCPDKEVRHTIDPVFLLSAEEWSELHETADVGQEPYMFIFMLKNNPQYFQTAIEEARKRGLRPLIFHCTQSEDTSYANLPELTPGQMLWVIAHADYVCTDSFHITVLSVIYQIQFEVFCKYPGYRKNAQNDRLYDLLDRLKIEGHVYHHGKPFDPEIDYARVEKQLLQEIQLGREYLVQAINDLPELESHPALTPGDEYEKKESQIYTIRKNQAVSSLDKKLFERMDLWDFALEESCYFSRDYQKTAYNGKKPLFYQELQADLENRNMGIPAIYKKYYAPFDVPKIVKRLLKKGEQV